VDRRGLLAEADGGVLFLHEVQDLPKSAQRKLARVFQDRQPRFCPVGSDKEASVRSGDKARYSGAARAESTRVDQRPPANPRQQGRDDKTPAGDADEGLVKRKAQAD